MRISSKILALGVLSLTRLVCAAPTNSAVLDVVAMRTDTDTSPFDVRFCANIDFVIPCQDEQLWSGDCAMLRPEWLGSLSYNPDINCTLYDGNMCNVNRPDSVVGGHIDLPYGSGYELTSVGWEKRANSVSCQRNNDFEGRSAAVIASRTEATDNHNDLSALVELTSRDEPVHNFNEPMYVDLCGNLWLSEPCDHSLNFTNGTCVGFRPDSTLPYLSSLRYQETITCTLFTGNLCDAPGSVVGDHIVLPYDVQADLTRIGWNKKANSMSCYWNDRALQSRNAVAIAAPVDNHHHDHDPMSIDICSGINFGGECLRGVTLFQGDCGVIENMAVSSVAFSDDLICLLSESSTCNSVSNLVLRGQEANLRNLDWNNRAHSIACLFKDDIFEEGSPLVTGPANLLTCEAEPVEDMASHHRDNEVMYIQLFEGILFGGNVINWNTKTGLCCRLPDMDIFKLSSIKHERGMVCTLFESTHCNKEDNLPTLDLPITESNLGPFGWKDRANSFKCMWSDDR